MPQVLKGITIGSIAGLVMGVLGYFIVVFWLLSQGITDSSDVVGIIRSKNAMYWSIPFTFVVIAASVFFSSKKIISSPYVVAIGVITVVGISIYSGPLKIISIHMNYLPLIMGAFVGAYLASKLNKALKSDAERAGAV